jgi:hypothetical protein
VVNHDRIKPDASRLLDAVDQVARCSHLVVRREAQSGRPSGNPSGNPVGVEQPLHVLRLERADFDLMMAATRPAWNSQCKTGLLEQMVLSCGEDSVLISVERLG